MKIKGLRALCPPPELAARVAAVPYDVVDTTEARRLAAGNPFSFLHVSRPEVDFASDCDPYAPEVYSAAAENFRRLQAMGALVREERECLYVYRLRVETHEQSGVVACCRTDDYVRGVIRRHETTRADKETDRMRHILATRSHGGPVLMAYRDDEEVRKLINAVKQQNPLFRFVAEDGVEHTLWRAWPPTGIQLAFEVVWRAYIADGHHRAAAAVRAAETLRATDPRCTGEEEYNWFLGVLFPASELRVFPIHRVVKDFDGLKASEFLDAVQRTFVVVEDDARPLTPGAFKMYCRGKWYHVSWPHAAAADPMEQLDVSVLQNRLLRPILKISDPRQDQRLEFIGGCEQAAALEELVNTGRAAVAFLMSPVTMDQVMAVADAGLTMPPKSTWFWPKLRSGLVVHTF